jgi:CheY-specific phosphatase CheX
LHARTSDILNRITIETCETLLEGMGLTARHVSSREAWELGGEAGCRVAVIGFGGETLRGSLVLDFPAAVITRTHPRKSEIDADLEDWVGELANLLLGRVKARLLPYDAVIQLSTPLVVSGRSRVEQTTPHSVVHTFLADEGRFRVLLAADADKELELGETSPQEAAPMVDEMVMF